MKCPEHVLKCSIDKNLNEYFKSRKIADVEMDKILYEVKARVCKIYDIRLEEYYKGKHACYKDVDIWWVVPPSPYPISICPKIGRDEKGDLIFYVEYSCRSCTESGGKCTCKCVRAPYCDGAEINVKGTRKFHKVVSLLSEGYRVFEFYKIYVCDLIRKTAKEYDGYPCKLEFLIDRTVFDYVMFDPLCL